ncbi:glycosyltransferase family 2 protein [Mariniflexile aquimaris]|uniref:Glycosyltransferase family 2 protein n=1 Tax=Mariniflexile aquimaris TaxID=881009 RepID=A0ABW3BT11_9FLAO
MKKISIIIPMYNVAKYLETCVNSVINQEIEEKDYEILMINDGSTDNSEEVAKSLASRTPCIKIISQKNKGLGGARNTGIENATGEFLIFLDADDVLFYGSLKNLIQISEKDKLDILEFGANKIDTNGIVLSTIQKDSHGNIFNGIDYYKQIKYMGSACNKIYRRQFLLENNLWFLEHIYGEDFEFNTRVLFFTNRIRAVSLIGAEFLQTTSSITRSTDKASKEKYLRSFIIILKNIVSFKNDEVKHHDHRIEDFFLERLTLTNIDIFYMMFKHDFTFKEMEAIKNELKENNILFLNNKVADKQKNLFRIIISKAFYILKSLIFIKSLIKNKL